jgi:hypothetical protein
MGAILTSYSRPAETLTSSSAEGAEPARDVSQLGESSGTSGEKRGPLADPIAEARRLIDAGSAQGLTVRVLGGVAVHMQSPGGRPLLPRPLKDIDIVIPRGDGRRVARLLENLDYVGEEMFNAMRGSRRQLFHDVANARQLDVFVGEFSMCHSLPIADRLDRHPYTVPVAELILTKLQIVELNERDERDIYTLCYHHDVVLGSADGIEADVISNLCAADWGLWRTCQGTIERCCADIHQYELEPSARDVIESRLRRLWERIDAAPKTGKWKRRSRVGERVRWYQEPEET